MAFVRHLNVALWLSQAWPQNYIGVVEKISSVPTLFEQDQLFI